MRKVRTWTARERTDRIVAWAIVTSLVGTFAPATLIADGSWSRWWDAMTPPIFLTSSEALGVGLLASNLFVLQVVLTDLPARGPVRQPARGSAAGVVRGVDAQAVRH